MFKQALAFFFFSLVIVGVSNAQNETSSTGDIIIGLKKLNVLGSVLYFAAHPDDENTRLIAWLAQEKKYRTGYLSLTRGEGGQNLIGTHLGIDLGLIRTHELLGARGIDKGEQLFSSAYDFGFSKTHQETFNFWEKDQILREAVYIIRKFQPDIIITRFPPDKRGGHGHHQASAILAHEAFIAAADPSRYPEQFNEVRPWKTRRLVWNTANFGGMNNTSEDQLKINIGAYNAFVGQSYGEIASHSRSQHKSQGFGTASTRGNSVEYFEHVAGDKAQSDLMEGIGTSWSRIKGTEKIQTLINRVNQDFNPNHPQKIIESLFQLRGEIQKIPDTYWKELKTKEVEDLIVACAGIWMEATTDRPQLTVDQQFPVTVEAIVRNPGVPVQIISINNLPNPASLLENTLWKSQVNYSSQKTTQPYWLYNPIAKGSYQIGSENYGSPTNSIRPKLQIDLKIGDNNLSVDRDILFRSVDPVRGEIHQDIVILPKLTVETKERNILFTANETKEIEVTFSNHEPHNRKYQVRISKPDMWFIDDEIIDLDFSDSNVISRRLSIRPQGPKADKGQLLFLLNNAPLSSIQTISYDHIPSVTWFPTTSIQLQHVDLVNPIKKIGYIAGAGDLIPQALDNINIEVSLLSDNHIKADYLQQFDAIVLGVRYFNVNDKSESALIELLKYVENGGVVLVQYNVNARLLVNQLGPYPFKLSRDRVTEEDAVVDFDSKDPVFNYPNKITAKDFDHWVQERGLYFATDIHSAYRTPIKMKDTDEPLSNGSLLIANYGKGKFVYTSLSFFRQLPAGVPGAYRLFVNLLTKEN